ncbi:uncharacterized protein CDAR_599971 [Caerostris darwini]|uniref:Uncharacterized protein n=1 Tax=Caerostris darwini TaxID=1538125 RepID=A0AAV4RSI6_9ARAC|nr:uncharacterized protein CDAR_599971 [Caerostris darwini]
MTYRIGNGSEIFKFISIAWYEDRDDNASEMNVLRAFENLMIRFAIRLYYSGKTFLFQLNYVRLHLDIQKYVIKRIFQNSYQKAIEDGTIDEFDHKNPPLNDKVLEVIKPIYESLSADSLLERCLGSETQNNNESLNSLIWTFAPMHIHAGPKTIEIATFFAVSIFNEGFIHILKILDVMGITIGPEANAFAARRDEKRKERSELRTSEASKEVELHVFTREHRRMSILK